MWLLQARPPCVQEQVEMSGFLVSLNGDSAPNSVGALGEQVVQRVPNDKDWEGTRWYNSVQEAWPGSAGKLGPRALSGIGPAFSHDPPPPKGLGQTSV